MTTYTWNITNLEREIADGYVYTVHHAVNAQDDTYSAYVCGSIGLERPDILVPFADLTEDLVVGWVKDQFGADKVAEIESALQAQLDEQRTPTKAAGLPWAG